MRRAVLLLVLLAGCAGEDPSVGEQVTTTTVSEECEQLSRQVLDALLRGEERPEGARELIDVCT